MARDLNKLAVAVVGHGRSGKDTAAEFLGQLTGLRYVGSTSWIGLDYMASRLGLCPMTAWETRHAHRVRWKQYLDEYRADDPAKLVRLSLERGEIVSGIRDRCELVAAREHGLVRHIVWIQRDVPVDPTVTFTMQDCDWVIRNDADLDTFRARVAFWAGSVGLPIRMSENGSAGVEPLNLTAVTA